MSWTQLLDCPSSHRRSASHRRPALRHEGRTGRAWTALRREACRCGPVGSRPGAPPWHAHSLTWGLLCCFETQTHRHVPPYSAASGLGRPRRSATPEEGQDSYGSRSASHPAPPRPLRHRRVLLPRTASRLPLPVCRAVRLALRSVGDLLHGNVVPSDSGHCERSRTSEQSLAFGAPTPGSASHEARANPGHEGR